MVRDRYKEARGRKFVARPQGGGGSRGDSVASVSGGGVDSSGAHGGQRLLQIPRHIGPCLSRSVFPSSDVVI